MLFPCCVISYQEEQEDYEGCELSVLKSKRSDEMKLRCSRISQQPIDNNSKQGTTPNALAEILHNRTSVGLRYS